MGNEVTQVKPATGAATLRKNADTAQKCALGSDGKCGFCQRTGYPILPLRYAVKPTFVRGSRLSLQSLPQMEKFAAHPLKGNRYTLRVLRKGYVHVYMGVKGHWQTYVVTEDGYLRLLKNPSDPDAKLDRPLTDACKRDGHNIPASFINIPDRYKKVWIGFSDTPWRKEVRNAFEAKPDRRMQQVDITLLAADPSKHAGGLELTEDGGAVHTFVEEYTKDGAEYKSRQSYKANIVSAEKPDSGMFQWQSIHGDFPRGGQLAAMGVHASSYHKKTKRKVAALALFDPVGMVQELNGHVAHFVKCRQEFGVSVMRPLIVSQSLVGLKKFFEQAAAANREQQETKDKKPDKQYEPDYEALPMSGTGGIPVYPMKQTTRAERAKRDADDAWKRIAARYDEGARVTFDQRYQSGMMQYEQQIEQQGGDWAIWADSEDWRAHFRDYVTPYAADFKAFLEMVALSISGGTGEDKVSQALWVKWLSSKPDADFNPVFRGLFGDRKELLAFLLPEKNSLSTKDNELNKGDKLYDIAKNILASKEVDAPGKLEELIDGRAKQWASSLMATIGAVAARTEQKLSQEASKTINRAMQASQYFYSGVSVIFINVKMTIGDYLGLLKERGAKVGTSARKQVNSLLLAGFLSITDPKVRDTLIEVTIWTLEKASVVKTALQDAAKFSKTANAEVMSQMRVSAVMLSSKAISELQSLAGNIQLKSKEARAFASDLLKRNVKIAAVGEPVLAAGAVYFQSWALRDSIKSVKEKLGKEGDEAQLSLISASIGVLAASMEAIGASMKVVGTELLGKMLIRLAGWIALASGIVDAIQAFSASRRAAARGDTQAADYYLMATAALLGGTFAGAAALAMSSTSLVGGTLVLGPLGWAIILVAGGVFLLWLAMNAESTAAERWADRCYFGKNTLGKGLWTSNQINEEMGELNALVSGLRIELGSRNFTTRWFGEDKFSDDNVKLRITFGMFSEKTSTYEWIWFARHRKKGHVELKRGRFGVPAFPLNTVSLLSATELKGVDQVRVNPGPDSSTTVVELYAQLDSAIYAETTVVINFWPDAMSSEDCLAGSLVTEEV
ncbi:T6SS effector BTH_I2691 family protein [Herbaspirillum seropedicae]|uniref:T6SS effector BTH_I2691 family protein n=1 Tax=Herbaspirillum seropedicae TaxID=964 RepID=UPI00285B32AB|nr:T6SS effector BTH_I2691 family protein [Herbaspirillum seropedicae]MDR6396907.1 hypothetical protein [Herbaspirillum seropedicae]